MNLDLHLTTDCNMECKFCGAWEQEMQGVSMSREDALFALTEGKGMGYKLVTLTGGEPTLNPAFEEIVHDACELGYWVCITTNGLIAKDNFLKSIKNKKVMIRVSLHTLNREKHREITGHDTFEGVMRSIRLLKEYRIFYGLGFTAYEENIDEIKGISRFAWENSASFVRFTPVVGMRKAKEIILEREFYYNMLKTIAELSARNIEKLEYAKTGGLRGMEMLDVMLTRQCPAGSFLHIILDAEKTVVPCSFIDQQYNMHYPGFRSRQDFKRIIERMRDFFAEAKSRGFAGICGECSYRNVCAGGCLTTKFPFGMKVTDEQPVCVRQIVRRIVSEMQEEAAARLVDYWLYHFSRKISGVDRNKSCMRRLPLWEINFRPDGDRSSIPFHSD
jgi:radical SAM protein with 4Fe4S-binding SPASM domain